MRGRLTRQLERLAIPHLTVLLTCGLTLFFGMRLLWPGALDRFEFQRDLVLGGEYWRVVTFMLVPPAWHPLFAVFSLYLFYLMGTALEGEWGEPRFNLYLLIGWLATVGAAFIAPFGVASSTYVLGSVFLAFARLYPHFVLNIFFVLPIEIRWLALVTWIFYGIQLLLGDWMARLLVLAAIANYLVFFGRDILRGARAAKRRMEFQAQTIRDGDVAFHRCAVCGATEQSHPDAEFRVCDECSAGHEYCPAHLHQHEHQ